ncbi:MAG: Coenzyme A biosynthesis bifunctional protein CoaBC [Candidatus Omnitrophica bacterium]|nr:Coenzyme A biosynthesis bifunctional protein CoaBC [Candidatus Omnitrophota bacterium]
MSAASNKRVLLGVTASIAAYKACDLITELRGKGHDVDVVMTRDTRHFITALTLQSFAGRPVIEDFFSIEGRLKPVHIELARSSDVVLIAPATADVIARLAHGLADDVLTCTVLATDAPVVLAPAMNEKMYLHPRTQENLKKLKDSGVTVVEPVQGHLVCSEHGLGHIADNSAILAAVDRALVSGRARR